MANKWDGIYDTVQSSDQNNNAHPMSNNSDKWGALYEPIQNNLKDSDNKIISKSSNLDYNQLDPRNPAIEQGQLDSSIAHAVLSPFRQLEQYGADALHNYKLISDDAHDAITSVNKQSEKDYQAIPDSKVKTTGDVIGSVIPFALGEAPALAAIKSAPYISDAYNAFNGLGKLAKATSVVGENALRGGIQGALTYTGDDQSAKDKAINGAETGAVAGSIIHGLSKGALTATNSLLSTLGNDELTAKQSAFEDAKNKLSSMSPDEKNKLASSFYNPQEMQNLTDYNSLGLRKVGLNPINGVVPSTGQGSYYNTSDVLRNPETDRLYQALSSKVPTLADAQLEKNKALQMKGALLAKSFLPYGEKEIPTASDLGADLRGSLIQKRDGYDSGIDKLYSEADSKAGSNPNYIDTSGIDNIKGVINNNKRNLNTSQDRIALHKTIGNVFDDLYSSPKIESNPSSLILDQKPVGQSFRDFAENAKTPDPVEIMPKRITIPQAENYRKYLNSVWKPDYSQPIGLVKSALDDEVSKATQGTPIYDNARNLFSQRQSVFENNPITQKILSENGKDLNGNPFYNMSNQDVFNHYNGKGSGSIEGINQLTGSLPKNSDIQSRAKARIVSDMLNSATGNGTTQAGDAVLSGLGLQRQLGKMDEQKMLSQGFTPEQISKINQFGSVVERLQNPTAVPKNTNPSGTSLLKEAMDNIENSSQSSSKIPSVLGFLGKKIGLGSTVGDASKAAANAISSSSNEAAKQFEQKRLAAMLLDPYLYASENVNPSANRANQILQTNRDFKSNQATEKARQMARFINNAAVTAYKKEHQKEGQ